MPIVTYKCTSCGGELKYHADTQKFSCEYCLSEFTKEELEAKEPVVTEDDTKKENDDDAKDEFGDAVCYTCPSCGGEIITDKTTAATECYYCHNPVVLAGRLSGSFLPKRLIPFKFDRKTAIDKFLAWTKQKFFLPKDFFSDEQIEKLAGVYFPYWIIDCDNSSSLTASGEHVHTWKTGDTQYTQTKVYDLEREGKVHLEDLVKTALKKANKQLVESVQPFDEQELEPFSMTYLSGFQAEKRDIEQSEIANEVYSDINHYSEEVLMQTTKEYSNVKTKNFDCHIDKIDWEYGLLPVWVLTYNYKENIYYYALNGQSGKTCGKLPVDKKKLSIFAGIISLAILGLMMFGGYFLI